MSKRRKPLRYRDVAFGTPRRLERRHGLRLSVHVWLLGFHFKARKGTLFRHLFLGTRWECAYGKPHGRMVLWLGTFTTLDGKRRSAHFVSFSATAQRHPYSKRLPFMQQSTRRERPEEA